MLCDVDQRTGCRKKNLWRTPEATQTPAFLYQGVCESPPSASFVDVCCSVSERYDGETAFSTTTRSETVGLRQVKAGAAGSSFFTAVKVLFKLIKYFQHKHLSTGSIIILTKHICLFSSTTKCRGTDDQWKGRALHIVNYQAISLYHVGITVRLVRHGAAMGNISYPLLSTFFKQSIDSRSSVFSHGE